MPSKIRASGGPPHRTHRLVVVTLAIWMVMALAAPVAADAGAGAGVLRINWVACGPQLECARVPVPWTGHTQAGR
jgi:hypothetical protein